MTLKQALEDFEIYIVRIYKSNGYYDVKLAREIEKPEEQVGIIIVENNEFIFKIKSNQNRGRRK